MYFTIHVKTYFEREHFLDIKPFTILVRHLLDMCVAVRIGIGRVTSSGWFIGYGVLGLTGLAFVPRDVHRGSVGPIPDPMGPTEVILTPPPTM